MKVVFSYYEDEDFELTSYPDIIVEEGRKKSSKEIPHTDSKEIRNLRKYLITGIMEDFQYVELFDDFFEELEKLERGEVEEVEWDGQAFQHKITKEKVEFTHTIFGECPEYPKWMCKYEEYKKILSGWRKFLEMPVNMKSKIEIYI